jgi:hypothetical protein
MLADTLDPDAKTAFRGSSELEPAAGARRAPPAFQAAFVEKEQKCVRNGCAIRPCDDAAAYLLSLQCGYNTEQCKEDPTPSRTLHEE